MGKMERVLGICVYHPTLELTVKGAVLIFNIFMTYIQQYRDTS